MAGYVYRATTDPCFYGWYIYMDLYSYTIWATIETTENSGNFTIVNVPFSFANDSPMQCRFKPVVHDVPHLGYVLLLSQDNNKIVYLLTSSGVYRVAAPNRCGYHCSKEKFSNLVRVPSSGTLLKVAYFVACFISFMALGFL